MPDPHYLEKIAKLVGDLAKTACEQDPAIGLAYLKKGEGCGLCLSCRARRLGSPKAPRYVSTSFEDRQPLLARQGVPHTHATHLLQHWGHPIGGYDADCSGCRAADAGEG